MTSAESARMLDGKVAVVTGAGKGLGLAYARAFAAAGASVVVNDADPMLAEAAVRSIQAAGGRAAAHPGAVGATDVAEALSARAVSEFGRLDILVTNAGILRDAVLWKMSDEDFDAVVTVHLRGTLTCVRAAAARMREQAQGGQIICIGWPTGQVGNFGQTNYAAAKAGIVGMVRTGALRARQPLPAYARRELSLGAPGDVAGLVVFLVSPAATDITGQASGLGGDRLALWSHPGEQVVAFADGGCSAEAIAAVWPKDFAGHMQAVGQHFPEPY